MGIESGLNNLLSAGQNLQQPDLVGKYFAGSQIAQNNQNQQFRNNLLDRQFNMDERKFNLLEAQEAQQAGQLQSLNQKISEYEIQYADNPKVNEALDLLKMQMTTDPKGAVESFASTVSAVGQFDIQSAGIDEQGYFIAKGMKDGVPTVVRFNGADNQPMKAQPRAGKDSFGFQFPGGGSFNMNQPSQGGAQVQTQTDQQGMVPSLTNTVVPPKVGTDGSVIMADQTGALQGGVVPNSEADIKRQATDKAFEVKRQQAKDVSSSAIAIVANVRENINNWNMGTVGAIAGLNPLGTSDRDKLLSIMEPLKANLALQAMEIARAGSAVGATGFGALSEKELALLQSTVNALNPNFPDEFWKGLGKVEYHFQRILGAANGEDIGEWNPEVYMNAGSREDYNRNKLDQASQEAKGNPLAPSNTPSVGSRATQAAEVIIEVNDETGQRRMSYDNGQTWEYE